MNAHEYLNTFVNFESNLHNLTAKEFDLSRMKQLLSALGEPQKGLRVIHVAGTKGKGSTCVLLSYILAAAGYRVGLYTSPHLHRLNERIRIFDKTVIDSNEDFAGSISDEQLNDVVSQLRPTVESFRDKGGFFTYFEVLTAAALVFFRQQNAEFVVLETGLGGRLDATNAVDSQIAVITPISLDHVNILGKTINAIAREKAGIIKSIKQKVVVAPQNPEAMGVVMQRCAEFGIAPVVADVQAVSKLKLPLKGTHQQTNAACALATISILRSQGHQISEQALRQGISKVRWPGRFEVVRKSPTVILDGAHNAESAKALAQNLAREYAGRKIILVLGFSSDKDVRAFLAPLKDLADTVIFSRANHPRAYVFDGATAKQLIPEKDVVVTESVPQAIEVGLKKAKIRGILVVTGSLFIVAEAREILCTN